MITVRSYVFFTFRRPSCGAQAANLSLSIYGISPSSLTLAMFESKWENASIFAEQVYTYHGLDDLLR